MNTFRAAGCIILVVAGCSDVMDPERTQPRMTNMFVADSLVILDNNGIAITGDVLFTYVNPLADTVLIVGCSGFAVALQKRINGRWRSVYGNGQLDCRAPPMVIPPHSGVVSGIGIFAPAAGQEWFPQFEVSPISGTYRLMVYNAVLDNPEDSAPRDTLPFQLRVSNTFELRVEE